MVVLVEVEPEGLADTAAVVAHRARNSAVLRYFTRVTVLSKQIKSRCRDTRPAERSYTGFVEVVLF